MKNDIEKKAFLMTVKYFIKTTIELIMKTIIILLVSYIIGSVMINKLAIIPKTYTPVITCVSIFCGLLVLLFVIDIIDIIKREFKYRRMLYEFEILYDIYKAKKERKDD